MKKILPILAIIGIFALAACSSDSESEATPSSSSSGGATLLSSSSLSSSSSSATTTQSSSSGSSSSSSATATPPGNTVGSCISSEVACYENIAEEDCEEDEVFYPGGTCDISVYSCCYENRKEINSSFTKSDCIDVYEDEYGVPVYALFVLPDACLIEPLSAK